MKITLKGNTSKDKKFFPAKEGKAAMLYFDIAEKIQHRDGTKETIWHKVRVSRGYAEAIYRGLHSEEPVSRFCQIEGHINEAPKTYVTGANQVSAYNTIWVDELTWLDQKWPKNESGLPENTEEPDEPEEDVAVVEADDVAPWEEL